LSAIFLEFSNNGLNRYLYLSQCKIQKCNKFFKRSILGSNIESIPVIRYYKNSQLGGIYSSPIRAPPVRTPIWSGVQLCGYIIIYSHTHMCRDLCNKIHIICVGIRRLSSHNHFRRSSNTALVLSHHPARSVQR